MPTREFRKKFEVEQSVTYQAAPSSSTAVEGKLKELAVDSRKLAAIPTEKPKLGKRRAVWISHGMGQQIPFATLDQVTEGLIKAAERSGIGPPEVGYRNVKVDKTVLQRVELKFSPKEAPPIAVDLYECYWAPKTEGVVKLKDVISFLWDGGSRGLLNSIKPFQRALFGQMECFRITWRTPTYLLFTLSILAALMVMNAVIVAAGASSLHVAGADKLITDAMRPLLTTLASIACLVTITFGVMLFLASLARPRWVGWPIWIALVFTALIIVANAAMMAPIVWLNVHPEWLKGLAEPRNIYGLTNVLVLVALLLIPLALIKGRLHSSDNESEESKRPLVLFTISVLIFLLSLLGIGWLIAHNGTFNERTLGAPPIASSGAIEGMIFSAFWLWPFLIAISAVVRELLVQYVGDVTTYISSYKIDRFEEVRQKIKDCAMETANAVYRAQTQNEHQVEYEKVAIVGHSLGSVIAYDTLNRLLNDDALSDNWLRVCDRTCLLLTFGSPLDKIAFFFNIMGKTTRHVREQLAAVVQPLLESRTVRETIPWVNVYSRNDVICGKLNFYDLPPGTDNSDTDNSIPKIKTVVNLKDKDALIPLTAHVEYWGNRMVWDELLKAIIAPSTKTQRIIPPAPAH
jgi:hypothetical protein